MNEKDKPGILTSSEVSVAFEALVAQMEPAGSAEGVLLLISKTKTISRELRVRDVWGREPGALTYWVLLLTGENDRQQAQLAKDLLAWQHFSAYNDALVRCVQSRDRQTFPSLVRAFRPKEIPCLYVSTDPDMVKSICVGTSFLNELAEQPDSFEHLIVNLHTMVIQGKTVEEIRAGIRNDAILRKLKVLGKELKSLLSITITASG